MIKHPFSNNDRKKSISSFVNTIPIYFTLDIIKDVTTFKAGTLLRSIQNFGTLFWWKCYETLFFVTQSNKMECLSLPSFKS